MKNFPFLFIAICLVLITSIVEAQHSNVFISDEYSPNETSIYINPKDPRIVVAGANLQSFYYSLDGGSNWTRNPLNSPLGVYGDPVLVIDTLGYIYYLHLSNTPSGTWLDRIVCQRSVNNGLSWNHHAGIGLNGNKVQDKEWAVVNPYTNELIVTWTQFDVYGSSNPLLKSNIMFSKSADQGVTWTDAIRINEISGDCVDSDNTVEGAVPAVGPNNEIYTSWAGPEGIVFDRSTDGGITWLDDDIKVSDMPGGWDYAIPGIYRSNGMPITCCDLSNGNNRGTIYINWSDQRNGTDDTDIWLSKSTDGGTSWSAPKRVNNDPPGKQQFFTWMCIDQTTGYLWFVFYDRRNQNGVLTDVYMAVSRDGGETFSNFKVSETPFKPFSSVFFGDYTCVSATNNIVRPIWTRLDTTQLSVWTALIDPLFTSSPENEGTPFSVENSAPNPFNESTVFSYKIRVPSQLTLEVHDVMGNKVTSVFENKYHRPGKYMERFYPANFHLPSGIYYFILRGNNMNKQRKIVYLK